MTKDQNNRFEVVVNSLVARDDGVVEFPNGLTITDDSRMWSGWSYDIDTLELDEYPGQLTADHIDSLQNILGVVEGVKKQGNKVTVDRIRYAVKESAYAKLAHDLLVGGFSNAFSIETAPTGNDDYENNVFHNHKLVGLSQVVMGNNKNAKVNRLGEIALIKNSISEAKKAGLDTSGVEHILNNEEGDAVATQAETKVEEAVIENEATEGAVEQPTPAEAEQVEKVEETEKSDTETAEETEAEKVEEVEENSAETEASDEEIVEESESKVETEENACGNEESTAVEVSEETETVETTEEPEATEEPAEEETEAQVAEETETEAEEEPEEKSEETSEEETKTDEEPAEESEETPAEQSAENKKTENKIEDTMTSVELEKAVNELVAKKLASIAEAQESAAAEPEFKEAETTEEKVDNNYRARYEKQVQAIVNIAKTKSIKAHQELEAINEYNFNALKEAGKISNTMTIAEFGNFVLPPEMYDDIIGIRTNYDAFLSILDWRETDRLEFSWLRRDGDIHMKPVSMCAPQNPTPITDASVDANTSNLKPVTQYGAHAVFEQLEEVAGVTPICNAARLFLAVDLVADAIAGYRNDFAFGKASLAIAKFQQAVNEAQTGLVYDYNAGSDLNNIRKFLEVLAAISDSTTNGRFIFTQRTLLKIKGFALGAGVNGPLGEIFINGSVPTIFGVPYTIVPNDLMPSIGDEVANNPKFVINGKEVEITATVFYGDVSHFIGYTRGGLTLDISDVASYGDSAQYSAYQRDEIVLRGYYFRGAAFRLPEAMAAITNKAAAGESSASSQSSQASS